jgi:hypothetical protein
MRALVVDDALDLDRQRRARRRERAEDALHVTGHIDLDVQRARQLAARCG